MAHNLRAAVGAAPTIGRLAAPWASARVIDLPQGLAMMLIDDALADVIDERIARRAPDPFPQLSHCSASLERVLLDASLAGAVAYVETDCCASPGAGLRGGAVSA